MNVTTIERPLKGEPLLPLATYRLRSRFTNFLISSGLCAPCGDALNEALENGFLAHHERGVVVTATSCDRPLFYPECETLARLLPLDLVLLRFDALAGATFDVLLAGRPFIQMGDAGLEVFESAPYANGYERFSGVIKAIDHPSFERRA